MKQLLSILIFCFVAFSAAQQEELVFQEEFNGTQLDKSVWNYMQGDGCPNLCGWGNNEPQIYTKENARVANGFLSITATNQNNVYNSSRITTKGKVEFQYGIVEVRAKLPKGKGLWPAIWMLGNDIDSNPWPNVGEIDIMEYVGKNPGVIYTSLHTASSYGETINSKQTNIAGIEDDFHVYKADWSKEQISFYIDKKLVYTYNPEQKNDRTWPYNKPFYMVLNMAIGGNFGGPEIDNSIFPQEFLIDYIRVYKQ